MLILYDSRGHPQPLVVDDYIINHDYDGYDTLSFDLSLNHPLCAQIAEESIIQDVSNRYIVKQRDERSGNIEITCTLDLQDWDERFWHEFQTDSITILETLQLFAPSGWAIENADFMRTRRSIQTDDDKPVTNVTARALLDKTASVFKIIFNFDTIGKRLIVIDPAGFKPSGEFLTDELNLKSVGMLGSTTDFATRMYCYGKDGMTFASINDGKEYVDDNSYSNRIICTSWTDERYTVKENLLAEAKEKLAALAHPVRSYECDVDSIGAWHMYQIVTLIDRRRKTRINHQIVAYEEHPLNRSQGKITLSSTVDRIENTFTQTANTANAASEKADRANKAINGMYTAKDVDKMIQEQSAQFSAALKTQADSFDQSLVDAKSDMSATLNSALVSERQTSDVKYAVKPMAGIAVLKEPDFVAAVPVHYENFAVSLTKLQEAGDCWAEIGPNALIIHASSAMPVQYIIHQTQ